MKISQRIENIKESATLSINAKAQELKANGVNIISLAVGEPDFPTPKHIIDAAKKALDNGETKYTPVAGTALLRKSIANHYSKKHNIEVKAEHIIVSNGGKQTLYNLLMTLVDKGDEVLVPSPYWVSYPAMVSLAEGIFVPVPTRASDNFLVTTKLLEEKVSPKTRVLILNSPSNPTGCYYTQEQLDEIALWAKERNIFIIADEVYEELVYAPAKQSTLCNFWEKNKEHVAISSALSKSMSMTGWRIGHCIAHKDLIDAMTKLQGQTTSNVNSIAQSAAVVAFNSPWTIIEEMKESFIKRRNMAHKIISSWDNVVCPLSDGAFYLFPTMSSYYSEKIPNSTALCSYLLEEAGVALVPGIAFGDDACLRISYVVNEKVLMEALNNITLALAKLKK